MMESSPGPCFNSQDALARAANDLSLLRQMADALAKVAPTMRNDLIRAVESGGSNAIFQSAHRLKGAVANFAAYSCVELAASIEAAGAAKDVAQARVLMPAMERELDRLLEALKKL